MKYSWLLLALLAYAQQDITNSEWEIHYLVSTYVASDHSELAEMLFHEDSTVVSILASDTIKRYHYQPGDSVVQRVYYLTEGEDIRIDPQSLQPIPNPVKINPNYSIDWDAVIKKTGNTKYIAGFKCEEYAGGAIQGDPGHEVDSYSRFWILALPDKHRRKLRPQYYLQGGIVLEKETTITSLATESTLMYTMRAIAVKQLRVAVNEQK
ncbi:MAG: hypothetical protein AAFP77_28990 [Bacteroidota bacterium]